MNILKSVTACNVVIIFLFTSALWAMDTQGFRYRFLTACQSGNENFVTRHPEMASQYFADLTPDGIEPLHYASGNGHQKIIRFLIANGAKLDAKTKNGETPLTLATYNNQPAAMRLLIEKGANANARDAAGNTLLHYAAIAKTSRAIKILLDDAHLDVDAIDSFGHTPLHHACLHGNLENAKTLISAGANLTAYSKKGATPLIASIVGSKINVATFLLSLKTVKNSLNDDANGQYSVPLFFAVMKKDVPAIRLLVQNGARADASLDGISVLDFSYWVKRNDIVTMLNNAWSIPQITDAQADENMRAFFKELDEEELATETKRKPKKRNRKRANKQHVEASATAPIIETEPGVVETGAPQEQDIREPSIVEAVALAEDAPKKDAAPAPCIRHHSVAVATTVPPLPPIRTPANYRVMQHEKLKWPKGLNPTQQRAMVTHLRALKNWPNSENLDVKKLKGVDNLYRMRLNSFRVIFSVDDDERCIRIHEIDLRKRVYKKLSVM